VLQRNKQYSGSVQLLADTRLNAILLFGPEKDKQDIRSLISQLDVSPQKPAARLMSTFLSIPMPPRWPRFWMGLSKG
jgi:general secretion pathway protein D